MDKWLKFWEVVDAIDWRSHQDYNKGGAIMFNNLKLSKAEVRTLRGVKQAYFKPLWDKLLVMFNADHDKDYHMSDDSLSDLCDEIIGRGWSYYKTVMECPEIAIKMARANDYEESFSYCFQGAYDDSDRDTDLADLNSAN
jgi:hypothetical protein